MINRLLYLRLPFLFVNVLNFLFLGEELSENKSPETVCTNKTRQDVLRSNSCSEKNSKSTCEQLRQTKEKDQASKEWKTTATSVVDYGRNVIGNYKDAGTSYLSSGISSITNKITTLSLVEQYAPWAEANDENENIQ